MAKLLFCNIGWMKYYQGVTLDDKAPVGGGGHNKTSTGHEACNFLNCGGKYYGYVQPSKSGRINIENILGTKNILDENLETSRVEGITVVWTSRNPDEDTSTIVGWYNNATVFAKYQEHKEYPSQINENLEFKGYRIEACEDDVVLLHHSDRTFPFPRVKVDDDIVGLGQSNIWYANKNLLTLAWKDKQGVFRRQIKSFRKRVLRYIKDRQIELDIIENNGFSTKEGKKITFTYY